MHSAPAVPDLTVPAATDLMYTSGTTGFPKGVEFRTTSPHRWAASFGYWPVITVRALVPI